MNDAHTAIPDAQVTLGTIIGEGASRDAIHVAVLACVAGEELEPGENIGILDGKAISRGAKPVGIVDPFLKEYVKEGEGFWMLLYPRTVTGLRHVWAHPDFEDPAPVVPDKAASEAWLREFIKYSDCPDYDTVIKAALEGGYSTGGGYGPIENSWNDPEYLLFLGTDAHGSIPDAFWDHVEIVTGKKVKKRAKYFTCSC